MLFALAEGHLDEGEDHKEALKAATEAVAICHELGDKDAMADMLRLVVKAYLLKAGIARYDKGVGGQASVAEALRKAEQIARAELVLFRQAGCLRGQAAMLLSVADVLLEQGGGTARAAALQAATEAQELFQRLGDKKMEAIALLTLADAQTASRDKGKALAAAKAAQAGLELFRDIGDKVGEAKALHKVAVSRIAADTYAAYTEALQFSKDALALFQDLGLKRLQAYELLTVAVLNLERESPEQAIPPAKQSLEIFRQIGRDHGAQAAALSVLVQAHNAREEDVQALHVANEGLVWVQNTGDKRQEVITQDTVAHTLLRCESPEEAMTAAKEGLAICRDLGDREWEALMLLTVCQVHVRQEQFQQAQEAAEEAIELLKALEETEHLLATAQHMLADVLCFLKSYPEAMQAAQEARDLFGEAEEWNGEALVLLLIAAITGDPQEAVATATRARDVFRKAGERRMEATALNALAELHASGQDHELALQAATARRALLQEAGFRREEAKSLHAIVAVHLASRDAAEAGRTAREGMRLARAEGDKVTELHMSIQAVQASVLLLCGTPEDEAKSLRSTGEEALKIAKDAVAAARKVGHGRLMGPALFWQAQVLQMLYSPDAAGVASEALAAFRRQRDRPGEAHALLLSAQCGASAGDRQRAEEGARAALAAFQACGDAEGQELAQELLAQLLGQRSAEAAPALQLQAAAELAPAQSQQLAPKGADPQAVQAKLRSLVLDALDTEDVSLDTPLMDSGLDSLASVSFRNEVSKEFNTNLPASLIFDYPSLSTLTQYIVDLVNEK